MIFRFVELYHGFELCYFIVILLLIYLGLFNHINCIFVSLLFAPASHAIICALGRGPFYATMHPPQNAASGSGGRAGDTLQTLEMLLCHFGSVTSHFSPL
jgi:hypothetical protein